jgi:cellulose synthase/poly-beta-1,6-N-acetylglucosamine synthase-like glycosyltransferase
MNIFAQITLWIAIILSTYFAVFWLLVLFEGPVEQKRKKWKSLPVITVAIPAYNEEASMRQTMLSVLKLKYPKEKLDIVVVNDGSSDKTEIIAKQVKTEFPNHRIKIFSQVNKGKGAALNVALNIAKGDFFVTMDADSTVYPDALNTLLSYFVEDNIAAVVPAMKVHKPSNFLQKLQWYEYNINMFYKDLMGRLDALHIIPGPFPAYRTNVLRKIGGFAEDGNLTEDLEITLRLQSHHYKIVQVMDAVVETIAPSTWKAFYAQRNRWFKGSFLNAVAYKRLMFNRKYGDFGMIQMPTLLISGVLALIIMGIMGYYFVESYYTGMTQLFSIHFDILTLIKNFNLDMIVFDWNFTNIALGLSMISMSVYVIFKSHKLCNEPIKKYGFFKLGIFMVIYYLVLAIVWAGVAFDLARGKRQRW